MHRFIDQEGGEFNPCHNTGEKVLYSIAEQMFDFYGQTERSVL